MTDFDSKAYLDKVDAWWRAANYLSVGQMYLRDNPLLDREVTADDVKITPIGHWGTIAGQNFVYAHLNRVINKYDLNMFYIEGPGHGGQVMQANAYLDGTWSEHYPEYPQNKEGMQKFFKYFSFPGGTGSHATAEIPGSIHEGGELGYSLSHATGAILDNPDVIAATVIGDGESETGPLAASWLSNSFINPVTDGAVLPILYLNGGKIANPTILERKSNEDLIKYFQGLGWDPMVVEGNDPEKVHPLMAKTLDQAIEKIKSIQGEARKGSAEEATMGNWPMILYRTPKGWTGPKAWKGNDIEGSFRAHQVPIPVNAENMEHVDALVDWLKSYRPEELFTEEGQLRPKIAEIAPKGDQRMASNPITDGGIDPKPLDLPDWRDYALDFETPGERDAQDMIEMGGYAAGVIEKNPDNFRIFGPDETKSNRLNKVFDVTKRQWLEPIKDNYDEWMSPSGRVIDSQLSEHQMEGFLEAYTLTGRHGFFASYEAFLRTVDSMITQHFKWMREASEYKWHKPYQSLNLISSSTAFQQDHNGYTHQDPGLLTHLAEKKGEFVRAYLPADTNSLLAVMDKALSSENVINYIVTSKHPRPQFFSVEEAEEFVDKGYKVIDWASTVEEGEEPDVVIAASGTEPTVETIATISYLHEAFPELKIRYVNVVDLYRLRHPNIDPRGLSDEEFDAVFTKDKPVFFGFHSFEGLLKDIFFDRHNHNLYPHGYREEGAITTPFDMRVLNELDRFHFAAHVAEVVYGDKAQDFIDQMNAKVEEHRAYIVEYGTDMPEVKEWKWQPLEK
ncbi:phosphoketolase family protein [Aerococcus mictus]|uniref:phosphoketolase family protein n=1 Tax=Aerococcus mictus TaxID=2976810 RepID=UPI000DCAF849|nr:phosphoketolase family protein [Aerococcus mictus]RAV71821.1 phosphoketolase [Aerococcus mictus]